MDNKAWKNINEYWHIPGGTVVQKVMLHSDSSTVLPFF